MRLIDMTGQRFGKLTVIRHVVRCGGTDTHWLCRCDCGTEKLVTRRNLVKKHGTISCGCERLQRMREISKRHGLSHTIEHSKWAGMLSRCRNPNYARFDRYGGRGIKVCERWLTFENFYADMGPRPSPRHEIDRIDNNGDYEPGNCRWATRAEQMANTSRSVILEAFGERQPIGHWARETGIDQRTLHRRMRKLGLTLEQAIDAGRRRLDG